MCTHVKNPVQDNAQAVSVRRQPEVRYACIPNEQSKPHIEEHDVIIDMSEFILQHGYPNAYGVKIPINKKLNIKLLDKLLKDYHDRELLLFLEYGWPANRLLSAPPPSINDVNHKSATEHAHEIDRYIEDEINNNRLIGPFSSNPVSHDRVGVSPLSTREKKSSQKRRIIVDLNYPDGRSVNDHTPKSNYLGFEVDLMFPNVDSLAERLYNLGLMAFLYKKDLLKAFRQILWDPADVSLFGISWKGYLYFDLALVMGHRISPYIMQRITDAYRYIHHNMGFYLLNYVDDFVGAETLDKVQRAYDTLTRTFEETGLEEAEEKSVPPTQCLDFLGVGFNSLLGIMYVSDDKRIDIMHEIEYWLTLKVFTRKQLEKLIGKLQFITCCVRFGRVFIYLYTLRTMRDKTPVDPEMRKDLLWWQKFLPIFNGKSIMWHHVDMTSRLQFSCDACFSGLGGYWKNKEYFRYKVCSKFQNIAHLEMWALILTIKVWGTEFSSYKILIESDNMAVVEVLGRNKSKDLFLQAGLREVAWL